MSGIAAQWTGGTDVECLLYSKMHDSGDGYVKLPCGIMIQWGRATSNSSGATSVARVTFVEKFSSTPYVVATAYFRHSAVKRMVQVYSDSPRENFMAWIFENNATTALANAPCNWIAIGKYEDDPA